MQTRFGRFTHVGIKNSVPIRIVQPKHNWKQKGINELMHVEIGVQQVAVDVQRCSSAGVRARSSVERSVGNFSRWSREPETSRNSNTSDNTSIDFISQSIRCVS